MDETVLCAALYRSRKAYETAIRSGLNPLEFSEAASCVVSAIGEQYKRDDKLSSADHDILRTQVERRFGKGSMADSVMDFVGRFPEQVSGINVLEEYRLLRLSKCATRLATLLATGDYGDETDELLALYNTLSAGEEAEAFKERLTFEDFEDDDAVRLPLYPRSLNDYIGGGLVRGHHMVLYGRPESGKTLFALNLACGAIRAGRKVLYVANEEPAHDITKRILSRLTTTPIEDLRDTETLRAAFRQCSKEYKNWTLLHQAGVSARDIRRHCARLRPDYVIVDQLKNLRCADDNRALQLDTVAQQMREVAIEFQCAVVSITQAGDSAEQKLVLSMTDIEWSNTGIPGAGDLMVGLGVNDQTLHTGKRILSICKNKANGRHGSFPVWIKPETTAVISAARVE